jgi:hypothetical protein
MLAKYKIEYAVPFHHQDQPHQFLTNDPVTCEETLMALLEHGFRIKTISHEGVELPQTEFDRLVKTAAGMLMSQHLRASLGIDRVEAHHRFGVPA